MHIDAFEEEFEDKILQRGANYYNNNYVTSLERVSDDTYQAEVEGSEIYDVEIHMDADGNIDCAYCNCPYDWGYCKHIAAVLYALRNTQRLTVTHNDLPSLLGKCSKNQLLEIILDHAKKDRNFKDHLRMKLSESNTPDTIFADFKKTADKVFDGYSDSDTLLQAADILFSRTEKVKDPLERIQIYAGILRYCVKNIGEFYNTAYDEDYTIFEIINEAEEILSAAVELTVSDNEPEKISAVWEILIANCYYDFDYDDENRFFPSFIHFAQIPEYREKLDSMLAANSAGTDEYTKKHIVNMRFEIIEKFGTEKERKDFINSHLTNAEFRTMAINDAISAKNYKKAEQLAIDGEKTDIDKPGTVKEWQKKLYEIYKASGETEKLHEICRVLIIDGDCNLYSEWKSLIPKAYRDDEIKKLLNESCNRSYEYIILKEKMADRIYKLCCKESHKIPQYYSKLKGSKFEEKGRELFEIYIRDTADRACDRSRYNEVCQLLKIFSKECDAVTVKKMASDFRELYCRKPAFMDELNKSGF